MIKKIDVNLAIYWIVLLLYSNNQGVYKTTDDHVFVDLSKSAHPPEEDTPQAPLDTFSSGDQLVRVTLPNSQVTEHYFTILTCTMCLYYLAPWHE